MRYALITGATSGIGLEYARQLAQRGYGIVVVSNQRNENERVAAMLGREYGVRALALFADLTQSDAAEELYAAIQREGIEIDILVNNAGMLLFSQLGRTAPAALDRIVALHCSTPAKLCRLFSADMCRRGRGHILLMSSVTAWMPYPTVSHYAATKAFLKSFGEALWYELRGSGVTVTTVFPSAVDTPLYDLDNDTRRKLLRLGVMMSAQEAARKALKAMFRGRRRCLPGLLTKLSAAACSILPPCVLLAVMKLPAIKRILERV